MTDSRLVGWIAFYNKDKFEIYKHCNNCGGTGDGSNYTYTGVCPTCKGVFAKDLYDAKKKAIAHWNIPMSKWNLMAIEPGYEAT